MLAQDRVPPNRMCGLAGIFARHEGSSRTVRLMTSVLRHRGPDDAGFWADNEAGLALGHVRLSILDTSPAGHQPMVSACGRFIIAFNGEIYNHMDLRRELAAVSAAPSWLGHSDTETLLAAVAQWGVTEALRRCWGMFALALWDREQGTLHLARDRMGEKPLYYGWAGGQFSFASELKAFRSHPAFQRRLSPAAVQQYLRFGYVPAPLSIWQDVYKLEPGTILSVTSPLTGPPDLPLRPGEKCSGSTMARFWSLAETIDAGAAERLADDATALAQLEDVMSNAVRRQMISDVPLGTFLSGGLDSSLVVALMQKSSATPVRSFTVGFEDAAFDESPFAAAVARHLGTRHSVIRVTAIEARSAIERMPQIFDEPFADASQIPTWLISQRARSDVTVALTGDGGDEVFGGYERYQRVPALWSAFRTAPFPLRKRLGCTIAAIPPHMWEKLPGRRWADGTKRPRQVGDRLHRLAARLRSVQNIDDLYLDLVSSWHDPQRVAASADPTAIQFLLQDPVPASVMKDPVGRMMYFDALTYLPDDILCKVDRTAMSVSLETRAPFLDPEVIALAARLPLHMRIRHGQGKWLLRQLLYKFVPRELVDRPKRGFFLPIGQWLRGPLRDWAEDLLDPNKLAAGGHLSPLPIRQMWNEHVAGDRDWTLQAWTILMFQAWAAANL